MKAVECFHKHLPLEDTEGRMPLTWELTKPHFGNFFTETGRGMTGFFSEPVRGFREGGVPYSAPFSSVLNKNCILGFCFPGSFSSSLWMT